MANDATVSLYGTIISDPANKQTSTGKTMLNMKCSVQTTKKSDDPKYPYATDIYDVIAFGAFAETLMQSVKKGSKVYVIGDLQMGKPWNDRNGVTHVDPQVVVSKCKVTSGGNWNNNSRPAPAPAPAADPTEDAPF